MTQNDAVKKHKCAFCLYSTNRNFDLKRHHTAKHSEEIYPKTEGLNIEKNVTSNEKNVTPNEKNVTPNEKNVTFSQRNVFSSQLCYRKSYKRYYIQKHL